MALRKFPLFCWALDMISSPVNVLIACEKSGKCPLISSMLTLECVIAGGVGGEPPAAAGGECPPRRRAQTRETED